MLNTMQNMRLDKTCQADFATIVDVLKYRAEHQPHVLAYTFLDQRARVIREITYAQLHQAVSNIANSLRQKAAPYARVVLLFPTGLEFVSAFLGAMYANIIPVPINVPNSANQWPRFRAIIDDCDANLVFTTNELRESVTAGVASNTNNKQLDVVSVGELTTAVNGPLLPEFIHPHNVAFLQYTSGTTGVPKGVVVTHDNLVFNEKLIANHIKPVDGSSVVGWLPLYHDMGLIGNLLQPLYAGMPCVLMPPLAFLRDPFQWLKCISDYKATISGGPNFAYELCANRIKDDKLDSLDLTRWETAFCGSEKIQPTTIDKFAQRFKRCGFEAKAFQPCYGLAEATLFVSGKTTDSCVARRTVSKMGLHRRKLLNSESPADAMDIIGCGQVFDGSVIIVDPKTRHRLTDNNIGEIWVRGRHVANGYWQRQQLNDELFSAKTNNTGEGPFLRTGDLGFIGDNELFITGRLKELIIIRGKNFYPEDIEVTARMSHQDLLDCRGAAFSIECDNEERLVLVQEVKKKDARPENYTQYAANIRIAMSSSQHVDLYDIAFVSQKELPVTSSGKIQRIKCRQDYLDRRYSHCAEGQGLV